MRCPKCHYLSFEPEPRCRNCGYDPALSDRVSQSDAPVAENTGTPESLAAYARESPRPAAPERPASSPTRRRRPAVAAAGARAAARAAALDLEIDPVAIVESPTDADAEAPPAFMSGAAPEVEPERPTPMRLMSPPADRAPEPASPGFAAALSQPSPSAAVPVSDLLAADFPAAVVPLRHDAPPRPATAAPPTGDLPLFVRRASDVGHVADQALLQVPASPRAPLAVQRRIPDTRGAGAQPRTLGTFDRDLIDDLRRLEKVERRQAAAQAQLAAELRAPARSDAVPVWSRLEAALIDVSILGSIGAAVVLFTLRWAGLGLEDITRLPLPPLFAYLLILAFGYLLLFTAAGGQTVGKMLAGIRVVAAGSDSTGARGLSLRQAVIRSGAALPSVLVAGLGFLPALFGRGLAVHDRLSDTRVVHT